jgi:hypothetical protein
MRKNMIFVFLSLAYLAQHDDLRLIYFPTNDIISLVFKALFALYSIV